MKIEIYTIEQKKEWENFLSNSNNGTLFASQNFFEYHPKDRFEHHHLMFYDRGKIVALFPAAEQIRDGKRFLVSHPGASFGGFILRKKTGINEAIKLVASLIEYAKDKNFDGIELTRPPWIYYEFPEDHIDFALFKAGAFHRKRELTAVVPLFDSIEKNLEIFRPTARTAMRKAIHSGIEIRENSEYDVFHKMLERNLSMRHDVAPTHTIDEIFKLDELMPGKMKQFSAYYKDKMVAGVLLFLCNPRTILAFYISQDYEHQNLRPLNLLFAEIFKWGIENKFRWFDFGTYTLNNVPNLGLARFKESLGAKGIFRDTLTIRA
ncbi:GNAT family N-acetyltransferase [bacterium]|nr:GNAT family N-acetyltransferase [bacterium]